MVFVPSGLDFYWLNFSNLFVFRLSTKLQGRSVSTRKTSQFVFLIKGQASKLFFCVCVVCVNGTRYSVCEGAKGHRTWRRNLLLLWRWFLWGKQRVLWMLHMWTVGGRDTSDHPNKKHEIPLCLWDLLLCSKSADEAPARSNPRLVSQLRSRLSTASTGYVRQTSVSTG